MEITPQKNKNGINDQNYEKLRDDISINRDSLLEYSNLKNKTEEGKLSQDSGDEEDKLNRFQNYHPVEREFLTFLTESNKGKYFDIDKIKNGDKNESEDEENLKTEKELLLSTINLAKNSGEDFGIEDISELNLKIISTHDLMFAEFNLKYYKESLNEETIKKYETIVKDIKQMEKIYLANYSSNEELQKDLIEDFNKFLVQDQEYFHNNELISGKSELYVVKYNDQVISFMRFDLKKVAYNTLYFKSFNSDKNIQGSGIGKMMLKAILEKKASEKGCKIIADCISSKPISSFYIENGFIARQFSALHGEQLLSIVRKDKTIPETFKTKNMNREDILVGNNLPNGTIVNRSKDQESINFEYIVPKNYVDVRNLRPNYNTPEKYVLTRYFFDKKSKEWLTVFEPTRPLDDFL